MQICLSPGRETENLFGVALAANLFLYLYHSLINCILTNRIVRLLNRIHLTALLEYLELYKAYTLGLFLP